VRTFLRLPFFFRRLVHAVKCAADVLFVKTFQDLGLVEGETFSNTFSNKWRNYRLEFGRNLSPQFTPQSVPTQIIREYSEKLSNGFPRFSFGSVHRIALATAIIAQTARIQFQGVSL
jgi:hypothetical protein